jgi:AraC-like DNA-binding protein
MVEACYREIAPHSALRSHVECFWVASGASATFTVVPDGCVDFLFDSAGRGSARLIGAMTKPMHVPATASRDVVAVRFRPGGAHPFVRAPLDESTDAAIDLDQLGAAFRELGQIVLDGPRPRERVAILERWLLARAPAATDAIDAALLRIGESPFRVDRAAAELGTSRQYVARVVRQRTGLPPKVLARVLRLRRLLADPCGVSLAILAQRHGFADQSHLAREVRALTGRTMTDRTH